MVVGWVKVKVENRAGISLDWHIYKDGSSVDFIRGVRGSTIWIAAKSGSRIEVKAYLGGRLVYQSSQYVTFSKEDEKKIISFSCYAEPPKPKPEPPEPKPTPPEPKPKVYRGSWVLDIYVEPRRKVDIKVWLGGVLIREYKDTWYAHSTGYLYSNQKKNFRIEAYEDGKKVTDTIVTIDGSYLRYDGDKVKRTVILHLPPKPPEPKPPEPKPPEPRKHKIYGYIKDEEGKPIAGAFVRLDRYGYTATTDSRGYYEFVMEHSGVFYLIVERGGYEPVRERVFFTGVSDVRKDVVLRRKKPPTPPKPPEPKPIPIPKPIPEPEPPKPKPPEPKKYKIYGYVKDEEGKPVAGAFVRLNGKITTTDGKGYYEFVVDRSGVFKLVVEKGGYMPVEIPVTFLGISDLRQDVTLKRKVEPKPPEPKKGEKYELVFVYKKLWYAPANAAERAAEILAKTTTKVLEKLGGWKYLGKRVDEGKNEIIIEIEKVGSPAIPLPYIVVLAFTGLLALGIIVYYAYLRKVEERKIVEIAHRDHLLKAADKLFEEGAITASEYAKIVKALTEKVSEEDVEKVEKEKGLVDYLKQTWEMLKYALPLILIISIIKALKD